MTVIQAAEFAKKKKIDSIWFKFHHHTTQKLSKFNGLLMCDIPTFIFFAWLKLWGYSSCYIISPSWSKQLINNKKQIKKTSTILFRYCFSSNSQACLAHYFKNCDDFFSRFQRYNLVWKHLLILIPNNKNQATSLEVTSLEVLSFRASLNNMLWKETNKILFTHICEICPDIETTWMGWTG